MLSIHVIEGKQNRAAFKSLKHAPANVRRGIQKAFLIERRELEDDTDQSMKEGKTGRDYFVYVGKGGRRLKRGRWHRASSKSESPAILTGALRKSLGFQIQKGKKLTYGANTPYARRWELSGRTYLGRSIRKRGSAIRYTLRDQIKKNLIGDLK